MGAMTRNNVNGSGPQPREGSGSPHPGRFARRRRPASAAAPPLLGADHSAACVSRADVLRRAVAAGVATKGRPLGEIARDVAVAEACTLVGVPASADAAAGGEGTATQRAAAAVAEGVRPDAAILAALRRRKA